MNGILLPDGFTVEIPDDPYQAFLDVANTWSANQLLSGTNELQFDSSINHIKATAAGTVLLNANATLNLGIAGGTEVQLTASGLDVVNTVRGVGFIADGDSGGATSGAIEYTGTTVAASIGLPLFPALFAGGNAGGVGWIRVYVPTGAVHSQYWKYREKVT